ncbi:diguanylate cyclase (GGDEF) domain-containing protein [Ruminococcus sp. YE71]|uniref:GGDEF domain-containing protein n=1 Tax=unclassified Ruminococcus TaxID=2608920 RepID=UPI0008851511|nr:MULTISPECIES: GGDEF domain-containing protein [unclassified Ruminococcus]SDA24009.1 diguanylate cyclase (GGDEF) domain-containing protein [Ruminococcus sp. YE78]SFW40871.1 diguanylate cyclase (GGDEF) domain-containing protein [Ruminococcus sp. YE71]
MAYNIHDLTEFSNYIKPIACVISVEMFPDGSYGNIRIVTGNDAYLASGKNYGDDVTAVHHVEFIPDQPYERYILKDLNFEEYCYRSAVLGETLHSYIHPEKLPFWLYLTVMPLNSDKENIYYCLYSQEISQRTNYSYLTNIAPDISAQVLQICIKLRGTDDFMTTMDEVIGDIRDLCDAEHCCILTSDFAQRKCAVLCEALSKDTKLLSMKHYVNDDFFYIVETWPETIAGSSCIIIKDEQDWKYLEKINPVWYESMQSAGAKSLVLFPLKVRDETLGFIWAINFNTDHSQKIRSLLDLTTYFLASELANHQLFRRLEDISLTDLLTGVKNRNAMNSRIDSMIAEEYDPTLNAGIVYADLNGLKTVNDTDGHYAGDLLLKDAALMLQRHFPDCEIFRAGGDEFMVLSVKMSEEQLAASVEKLRQASCDPDGVCFAIGFSFGKVGDIVKTMRTADVNMYRDKQRFYMMHPERKGYRK